MELYREIILDHYHHPRNYGTITRFNASTSLENISCGDTLQMRILIENNTIEAIAFEGSGCAISVASASLLTEKAKGQNITDVLSFTQQTMFDLLGMEVGLGRIKCVLLPLQTLHKTLHSFVSQSHPI